MSSATQTWEAKTRSLDDEGFRSTADALERRLLTLFEDEPIPYRRQNGGDSKPLVDETCSRGSGAEQETLTSDKRVWRTRPV